MSEDTTKRGPGRPPKKHKEEVEQPKVEAPEPQPQPEEKKQPEKVVEKIIAASGDERSVAATLDSVSGDWTDEKIKQVVESVDPMTFTEPQKVVLDRVKEAHPHFDVAYRYIRDDKERVSKASYIEYWKPVNRSTHPNVPNDLINDRFGCVECMGQILMFRPREIDTVFVQKPRIQHREKLKDLEEKSEFDDRFYKPKSGEVKGRAFYQDEDSEEKDFVNDFVEE